MMDWIKNSSELKQSKISIFIAFVSLIIAVYSIFSGINSDKFQNQFNNKLLDRLDTLTTTTRSLTNVFASSMSSYIQLKNYNIISINSKNGHREISPVLTISNIGKSEAQDVTITVTYYFNCFKNKSFIYKFDSIPFVKVNTYYANHRWDVTKIKIPNSQNKIISKILIKWYDTRLKKNDSIVELDRFQIFDNNKIFAIGLSSEQTQRAEKIFNSNRNSSIYHGMLERYF